MGEYEKDPNQSGIGKDEKGGKPAFDQFEKGQQKQEEFGQKGQGQEFAQGKEQYAQDKEPSPEGKQQYAQDKDQLGQGKTDQTGGQQQYEKPTQRQQGDEDLGDDSIDNQNLKSK